MKVLFCFFYIYQIYIESELQLHSLNLGNIKKKRERKMMMMKLVFKGNINWATHVTANYQQGMDINWSLIEIYFYYKKQKCIASSVSISFSMVAKYILWANFTLFMHATFSTIIIHLLSYTKWYRFVYRLWWG